MNQALPQTTKEAVSVLGQAASSPKLNLDFYRPRYIVLPTGRMVFAWGVFDTRGSRPLPTAIPKNSDFVSRHKDLGPAYRKARRLNEEHEREAAA